jgi:E3 ubiquitin-protein ligase DOA10
VLTLHLLCNLVSRIGDELKFNYENLIIVEIIVIYDEMSSTNQTRTLVNSMLNMNQNLFNETLRRLNYSTLVLIQNELKDENLEKKH